MRRKGLLIVGVMVLMLGSALAGAMAHRSGRVRRVVRGVLETARLINPNPAKTAKSAKNEPPPTLDPGVPGVRSLNDPSFLVRPGYDVEKVADGLTYPTTLTFPGNPGQAPDDPLLYFTELHNGVRYVSRDGKVHDYSGDLLHFQRVPHWRLHEVGFVGLIAVPDSEDLILTASHMDEASGRPKNHLLRLVSEPGGRRLARVDVILDIDELTSPGHAIGCARLGVDGKLYLGVGDGYDWTRSQDLDRWGGKILRMNIDGSACTDNPFYDPAQPRAARSYVYAYGFRNPFDHAHHPDTGVIYAVDHGPELDRLVTPLAGANYGWNGDSQSSRTNAVYVWSEIGNLSPGCVLFMKDHALGPSVFDTLLIAGFGPTAQPKADYSKSIVQFRVDPKRRMLSGPPTTLIRYVGGTCATVLGLAEGPDGLYFTDFFGRVIVEYPRGGDPDKVDVHDQFTGKAAIWRVVKNDKTLTAQSDAAATSPLAMGERLVRTTCTACHTIDGSGGLNGPDLTHAYTRLKQRVTNPAYDLKVAKLLTDEATRFEPYRTRLDAVVAAKDDARIRTWLHHHLEAPMFDNLNAQMPAFNLLPAEQRAAIIEYLMSRK